MRRTVLTAAIAAAVMAGWTAPGAQAVTVSAYDCTLRNVSGSATPGVMLVGGSGTYTFGGDADCTIATGANPVRETGRIRSSGTFTNVVCATATVVGSPFGSTTIDFGSVRDIVDMNYTTNLFGGAGPLLISSATSALGIEHSGEGTIAFTPRDKTCLDTSGINEFDVNGHFELHMRGATA